MDYISWIKQLDRGLVRGAYLCLVTEPYLWDSMKEVLKTHLLRQDFLDFNLDRISFMESDREGLENALETMPVMDDYRVVILEDVPLEKDQIKKAEDRLESVLSYLSDQNPSTLLFMSFQGDKPFQGKIYKQMKNLVSTVELGRLGPHELESFVEKIFQKNKLKWEKQVVSALIEASGYLDYRSEKTLYDVENMVQVAVGSAYMGRLELSRVQGVLYSGPEENIFQLMDSLSSRKVKDCLRLFEGYTKLGYNDQQLFFMLARQIRNLIAVKLLLQKRMGDRDGLRRLKLSPFEYNKLKKNVDRFSLEELTALHDRLFDIHRKDRTERVDLDLLIEDFLVRACLRA